MRTSTHSTKRRAPKKPAPEPADSHPGLTADETPAVRGSPPATDVVLAGSAATMADYMPALRILESAGAIRVQAVVSREPGGHSSLVNEFRNARAAPSVDKAVVAPGALVVLASLPHLHPAQAGAAFRRGWHVLTLSPLARSAPEAMTMLATAQRHERLLAVALPHRFSAGVNYIRVLCHDQLIGPLIRVDVHDGTPPAAAGAGGTDGALVEPGVGVLDLLTWCMGPPEIESYADDAMGGVEANASLRLMFPESVPAAIHLSRDWPTARSYEFVFERGIARWTPRRPESLQLQLASAPAALEGSFRPALVAGAATVPDAASAAEADPFRAQLQNVLDAIARRAPLAVPAADAVSALAMADACRARRTLLRQPWLSHNESVHARTLSMPIGLRRE